MGKDVALGKTFDLKYGPNLKSSESEIRKHSKSNAAKGYDLVITSSKAKNAVRIFKDAVIGKKLKLQLVPRARILGIDSQVAYEWAEVFEGHFENWANSISFDCDAKRQQNLTSIFRTLATTRYIAGSALATIEWSKGQIGYYTCVNMIDPARLCNPNNKANNEFLQNGIEINKFGAPIAYWIRSNHPNDFLLGKKVTWKRVPKYSKHGRPLILHSFAHERAEQTNGISRFSAVANDINNLKNYNAAEQDRARLASMFGAYIKSVLSYDDAFKIAGVSDNPEESVLEKINEASIKAAASYYKEMPSIGGASMLHLLPNEELGLIQSEQAIDAFEAFNTIANREISAGFGVDIHNMSKNYKDVSYSAARAAQEDAYKSYMIEREELINDFGMPIVSCLMEELIDNGKLKLPEGVKSFYENKQALCSGSFMGDGKPDIDPNKTAKANEINLKNGTISRSQICAAYGEDYRDVVDKIVRDKNYSESKGLTPEDFYPELKFNRSSVDATNAQNKKAEKEDEDDDD